MTRPLRERERSVFASLSLALCESEPPQRSFECVLAAPRAAPRAQLSTSGGPLAGRAGTDHAWRPRVCAWSGSERRIKEESNALRVFPTFTRFCARAAHVDVRDPAAWLRCVRPVLRAPRLPPSPACPPAARPDPSLSARTALGAAWRREWPRGCRSHARRQLAGCRWPARPCRCRHRRSGARRTGCWC